MKCDCHITGLIPLYKFTEHVTYSPPSNPSCTLVPTQPRGQLAWKEPLTLVASLAEDMAGPWFARSPGIWWCKMTPVSSPFIPPIWFAPEEVAQTVKDRLQCRRSGFEPWVGEMPWRREWQPTPVFLPGEPPWTEEPGGLQSMGLHIVWHDSVTKPPPPVKSICIS